LRTKDRNDAKKAGPEPRFPAYRQPGLERKVAQRVSASVTAFSSPTVTTGAEQEFSPVWCTQFLTVQATPQLTVSLSQGMD
jgi:hypothetical protein